jgi:hypothetical protein
VLVCYSERSWIEVVPVLWQLCVCKECFIIHFKIGRDDFWVGRGVSGWVIFMLVRESHYSWNFPRNNACTDTIVASVIMICLLANFRVGLCLELQI